jgi:hypothetical protein
LHCEPAAFGEPDPDAQPRNVAGLPIYFALHLIRAADMNFLSCGSPPGK